MTGQSCISLAPNKHFDTMEGNLGRLEEIFLRL